MFDTPPPSLSLFPPQLKQPVIDGEKDELKKRLCMCMYIGHWKLDQLPRPTGRRSRRKNR